MFFSKYFSSNDVMKKFFVRFAGGGCCGAARRGAVVAAAVAATCCTAAVQLPTTPFSSPPPPPGASPIKVIHGHPEMAIPIRGNGTVPQPDRVPLINPPTIHSSSHYNFRPWAMGNGQCLRLASHLR